MNATFSIDNLIHALKFPFEDPKWKGKMLIALAVSLGNFVLPIIPTVILYGYIYEIMHGVLVKREKPVLPEWADFGRFFTNGIKMFGIYFVYMLPGMLIYMVGFVVYMISVFMFAGSDPNQMTTAFPAGLMISMGIFYLSMFISMFFMILASLVLPTALAHMVAKEKFTAGFDFTGMWKVFRANMWGYLFGLIVLFGFLMCYLLVFEILYIGMFCCCLLFIGLVAISVYPMMVIPALISYMYLAGQETLEASGG